MSRQIQAYRHLQASSFIEKSQRVVYVIKSLASPHLTLSLGLQHLGYELLAEFSTGVGGMQAGALFASLCKSHLLEMCRY